MGIIEFIQKYWLNWLKHFNVSMRNQRLNRLEEERIRLFEDLEGLSTEKLDASVNGNWSINQILYHLWVVETSSIKYIQKKTKYPDYLVNVSPLTYLKPKILKLLLAFGVKLKAPKIVSQFPEKIDFHKLNKEWKSSRESLDQLIVELKEKKFDKKAILRHPILGRINLTLALDFFDFHFKHHQKAINLLKK